MNTRENKKAIVVKRDEDNPEPVEIIASAIIDIASFMRGLDRSRLNKRALVVLIQDATKLNKWHIETVLKSLNDLERLYLKPRLENEGI